MSTLVNRQDLQHANLYLAGLWRTLDVNYFRNYRYGYSVSLDIYCYHSAAANQVGPLKEENTITQSQ